jgi:hypothetical protein
MEDEESESDVNFNFFPLVLLVNSCSGKPDKNLFKIENRNL